MAVRKGDIFNILEPTVLDLWRSALGDAGSECEGEDQAEMRSELLGDDGGVSLSCAILCSRFWMPARSVCNLLSLLSNVPGKPECRWLGDVADASLHEASWSSAEALYLPGSDAVSGLEAGESPKNRDSI